MIPLAFSWPAALPLPLIDYSGKPRTTTVASPTDNAQIKRRSRSDKTYVSASCSWVLDIAQMDSFKTFFEDTLGNGAAAFSIELRYPRNSTLDFWETRFTGEYQATYQDGLWQVSAELDILNLVSLAEPALLVGYQAFYVESETSGEPPDPFYTSEGYSFAVRE